MAWIVMLALPVAANERPAQAWGIGWDDGLTVRRWLGGRWELAAAGRVRLDIFDVRGRRVRKLVDRDLPPGPHALGFDGRDDDGASLASGVYYILLDTGERKLRGRITLVR